MDTLATNDPLSKQILRFAFKAAIVFFLFTIAVSTFMPDPRDLVKSVRKAAKDEKTRVIMYSFVQNPGSLNRASEIDEKDGNLQAAIMEMEAAVGLLELHNVNQQIIYRYTTRLNNLRDKLKGTKNIE